MLARSLKQSTSPMTDTPSEIINGIKLACGLAWCRVPRRRRRRLGRATCTGICSRTPHLRHLTRLPDASAPKSLEAPQYGQAWRIVFGVRRLLWHLEQRTIARSRSVGTSMVWRQRLHCSLASAGFVFDRARVGGGSSATATADGSGWGCFFLLRLLSIVRSLGCGRAATQRRHGVSARLTSHFHIGVRAKRLY